MKFRVAFAITLSMIVSCARADTLTLPRLIKSVDEHFPVIEAARLEIQKAQAQYLSAKGGFDPTIRSRLLASPLGPYQNVYNTNQIEIPITDTGTDLFAGYRLGRGNFAFYDQGKYTYPYGELNAGITFPLLRDRNIDQRRARIKQSKINISISGEDLLLKQLSTTRNASFAYWDWVAEGRKLAIERRLLKLAKVRQDIIEQRFHQGDSPEIEAVENNQTIMRRRAAVKNQLRLFQRAAFYLSLFYRDQHGKPVLPTESMLPARFNYHKHRNDREKLSRQQILSLARHHPAIRRLGEQRDNIFIDLALAENSKKPILNNRVFVAQDFGPPEFAGNVPPLNRISVYYELRFEYPIYQRVARGSIKAAEKSLAQLDAQQRLRFDQIKIGIQDAANQLTIAKKVVLLAAREVSLAQKVESAEEIRFKHGDSSLFLVNQREQATANSKMREVDAVANYFKAKAMLLFAIGFLPER